jgi:hypothetical protein
MGKHLAVALLAAALLAGCDTGFDDPSLVRDLRILALKADPPEILYPAIAPFAVPADSDRRTRVTILLADPEGAGRGLTCTLRSCVLPTSRRCEGQASTVVLAQGPCGDGEASFDVDLPADLVAAVQQADTYFKACRQAHAFGLDPPCGYSGLAVWIEVVVSGGERDLYGLKSLVFAPRDPADREPNRNPEVTGLLVDGVPAPAGTLPFAPGVDAKVEPVRSDSSKQAYRLPRYTGGDPIDLTEDLSIRFLADAGSFDPATRTDRPRNVLVGSGTSEPPDMFSTWTPPATVPDRIRFWFVVDDGRGGVAWHAAVGTPAPASDPHAPDVSSGSPGESGPAGP